MSLIRVLARDSRIATAYYAHSSCGVSRPSVPSEITGTAALWAALVTSILIVVVTRPGAERLAASARPMTITLALQAIHFAEEFVTGFYRLFPRRLGLVEWSAEFFLAFNIAWLVLWYAVAVAAMTHRATTFAAVLFWFLALAAIGNGLAHPALALFAGGYFPGLITSPFLGLAGAFLAASLLNVEKQSA